MAKRNWIAGAIKHPGALHRELGVPMGEKIPAKKLAKAAKAGGKEGQRARLAMTLKGLHHGGASKGTEDKTMEHKKAAKAGHERGYGTARKPHHMKAEHHMHEDHKKAAPKKGAHHGKEIHIHGGTHVHHHSHKA